MQYVPAPLLQQVNIVDTPGTNVILDRQQRLTEEFVPRADLVLFCLSAGGTAAFTAANGDAIRWSLWQQNQGRQQQAVP